LHVVASISHSKRIEKIFTFYAYVSSSPYERISEFVLLLLAISLCIFDSIGSPPAFSIIIFDGLTIPLPSPWN